MAVSLLSGDAKDSSVFTVENLAGKPKGPPGLMQTAVSKKRLLSWFLEHLSCKVVSAASGASQLITAEGLGKLRAAAESPFSFFQKFARARGQADQDACTLRALIKENLATYSNALHGDAEQAALEFIAVLMTFEADGEVAELAASGRTFTSYFEDPDGDDDPSASGEDPLLHAYHVFKKARADAPVGVEEADSDAELFAVIPDDEQSALKSQVYQTVLNNRRATQRFVPLRSWDKKPWAEGAEAQGTHCARTEHTLPSSAGRMSFLNRVFNTCQQGWHQIVSGISGACVWDQCGSTVGAVSVG